MACAVHDTSAGDFSNTPNVFEVFAQKNLLATAKPAARYLINVLGNRWPNLLFMIDSNFEEISFFLDLLIQNYFLITYRASYSEAFYDMTRTSNRLMSCLTPVQHVFSLLELVVFPYLKLKVDHLYEDLLEKIHFQKTTMFALYFTKVYPHVHSLSEAMSFIYLVLYTLGYVSHHSLVTHLTGLRLIRAQRRLYQQSSEDTETSNTLSIWKKLIHYMLRVINVATAFLAKGLSISVFFLQFLQWWYNSDTVRTNLMSFPPPQPPVAINKISDLPGHYCFICRSIRTNHTVLSVSGYVFCYPCIFTYIEEHGCCPVTSYPCRADHLIRLYTDI